MNDKDTSSYVKMVIFNTSSPSQSEIPFLSSKYKQKNSRLSYKSRLSFYNSSSPIRRSSTTACERPLTPSFCIAFEMCSVCKEHVVHLNNIFPKRHCQKKLIKKLFINKLNFKKFNYKLLYFKER